MILLKKKVFIINKYNVLSLISIIYLFKIINSKVKKDKKGEIINEPILPINTEEYLVKKYQRSQFNLAHPRYYFQEKYKKRKLFKINYSYYPYHHLKKELSYEENAIFIYSSTGMLNITKLDYYYLNKESEVNVLELNHIHLSMALDQPYTNLSLISIASILNTSSSNTYIHFHILGLNFGINEIKKIIELKKINQKVEFIFYNAKQIEYDFERAKNELRGGYGNVARILCPQIINNTNRILMLDSGDILCQKDLSEIYFYDIGDNYFGWILEDCAGNYLRTDGKFDKFMSNNFHPNGGIILVNIRLFKKDKLYQKAVFVSESYRFFSCPVQSMLITIASYKFKFFPLNYNLNLFYDKEEDMVKKKKTESIQQWMDFQKLSPYKYTFDEIFDAISDPVIQHFYHGKLDGEYKCHKYVKQWLKYAKLTGVYNFLKLNYPNPFQCEKIFGLE